MGDTVPLEGTALDTEGVKDIELVWGIGAPQDVRGQPTAASLPCSSAGLTRVKCLLLCSSAPWREKTNSK